VEVEVQGFLMTHYVLYQNIDNLPFTDFIKAMARLYQEKRRAWPKECLVNPAHELDGVIAGIKIIPDDMTLPNEIMLR